MPAIRSVLAVLLLLAAPAAAQDHSTPPPPPQPFTDLSEIPPKLLRDAFMLKVWECRLKDMPDDERPVPTATPTTGAFFAPGWPKPFLELDFEALRRDGLSSGYHTQHTDRGASLDQILEIMTIGNMGVVYPGQPCPERRTE